MITGGNLFGLLLAELLAGNAEVLPEASGAICLTRFLMYSSASSTVGMSSFCHVLVPFRLEFQGERLFGILNDEL